MPITYRDPTETNAYRHTLPVCLFKVATSTSHRPPYPLLVDDGGNVIGGSGFNLRFHDCHREVSTTNMVWDSRLGAFRKERRAHAVPNIAIGSDAEGDYIKWMGNILRHEYPVYTPTVKHVRWIDNHDNLTTVRPLSYTDDMTVGPRKLRGAAAITGLAVDALGDWANFPGTFGYAYHFALWPGAPVTGPVSWAEGPCTQCRWTDILATAPHLSISVGAIRVYIVFPYRTISDPPTFVPGFVRTALDGRRYGFGYEFEIGYSTLLVSNQKDALLSWPQITVAMTEAANGFSVILDEASREETGSQSRRVAEPTAHAHMLEPWTPLATTAEGEVLDKRLWGNLLSTDHRSVYVPPGEGTMLLHSRMLRYEFAAQLSDYVTGASLEGAFSWDNRRTDIADWPNRVHVYGAMQREVASGSGGMAPYSPNVGMAFEWETNPAGKRTGRVHWTMDLSDCSDEFAAANPRIEDWAFCPQGFYLSTTPEWTMTGDVSYRDYGPVVETVEGESSEPRHCGINEYIIRIPLHSLEEHPELASTWRSEIVDFAPCEIWLGWVANTTGANAYNPATGNLAADLAPRLSGYIYQVKADAPGEGVKRYLTVQCRGELMRTQSPAGGIDSTFPPLDVLPAEMNPATGQVFGQKVHGHDAVRWLLQRVVGDAYDEAACPYGRYELQAFDDSFYEDQQELIGHLPILRGTASTRSGSLGWPAPYGQDAWRWLEEIARYDAAILFERPFPVDAENGVWRNRIVYTNWRHFLLEQSHNTIDLYAAPEPEEGNYVSWNQRIKREGEVRRPQEAINRVCVQAERDGSPFPMHEWFATDARSIALPATAGERWFGGSVNTAFVKVPGALALVAKKGQPHPGARTCALLAHMLFTRSNSRMEVTVPGLPYVWWGDVVRIPTTDPLRAPAAQRSYRIVALRERTRFGDDGFLYETTLTLSEEPAYFTT